MKKTLLVFAIGAFMLFLSSCGVFTKTQYDNGIKFNGEYGLFSKQKEDSFYLKRYYAKRAFKRNRDMGVEQQAHSRSIKPRQQHEYPESNTSDDFTSYVEVESVHWNKSNQKGVVRRLQPKSELADSTKPISGRKDIGYDRNAKAAGWLFYGGMFMRVATAFLIGLSPIFAVVSLLFGLGMIVGFIFAIISLVKIKEERERGNYLRGRGLSISVVVIFGLSIVFTIVSIIALAILLATL